MFVLGRGALGSWKPPSLPLGQILAMCLAESVQKYFVNFDIGISLSKKRPIYPFLPYAMQLMCSIHTYFGGARGC